MLIIMIKNKYKFFNYQKKWNYAKLIKDNKFIEEYSA